MLKPVYDYRHFIVCNMPMKFLLFLIKEKILSRYLDKTIQHHIRLKNNPVETLKYIFSHGKRNYIYLSFLYLGTDESSFWSKINKKWLASIAK